MANKYAGLVALNSDCLHDCSDFEMYESSLGSTNVHAEFMVEKSKRSGELELVHI